MAVIMLNIRSRSTDYSMLSSVAATGGTIWIDIYGHRWIRRHRILRWVRTIDRKGGNVTAEMNYRGFQQ
jgi:hypothetical protein